MRPLLFVTLMAAVTLSAQPFTRGVGIYPGDPKDDFSPSMQIDSTNYRNLALRRPAFHSSSYDYNLTPQLVTDGIKDTRLPRWVTVSTAQGEMKKYEREGLVDDNPVTGVEVKSPNAWVQIELGGGDTPLELDRIDVDARSRRNGGWQIAISGSDDGRTWAEVGRAKGVNAKGDASATSWNSVPLSAPSRSRFYRVAFEGDAPAWFASSLRFFRNGTRVRVGGPFDFTSAWKSAGTGEEWVYVDLGAPCTFDRVVLSWIRRAAEGSLQVSDDASAWRTLRALGDSDDIKLATPVRGRYVRVLMTRAASPVGYILSELEVFGRGGPVPVAKPAPAPRPDGRIDLAAGAWRLQRDSQVAAEWSGVVGARFPGFELGAGHGARDDPRQLLQCRRPGRSELRRQSTADFGLVLLCGFLVSRRVHGPPAASGAHTWLNFDGINWKADVYLNGEKIGRIEGGFQRGAFRRHFQAPSRTEECAGRARRKERHAGQRQTEDLREPR